MGHLLAPTSKHDAAPIDYWAAIVNPERISDYNWCEYVLKDLLKVVSKLKIDILNNRTIKHLEGCHLFLQVFYLDNVDLGIYNMSHNTLPMISEFKLSTFSGMILQCSNPSKYIEDYSNVRIRPAAEICYKRVVWDSTPDIQTPGLRNKPSNSNNPSPQPHTQCHRQSSPSIGTGSSWHTTPQTNVSSQHYRTPRLSTANDFSIHMKDKYPNLVYTEVGIMLKEHNAIPFKMIADVKDSILKENTRFLDKIAPKLENRCTGCLKRSIPCLLQPDNQAPPPNDSTFTTPDNNSGLKYRCLYTHDSEAFSPTSSSTNKRKGLHTSHHRQTGSLSLHKPESSTAVHGKSKHDTIKSWAKTIVGGIIMYNDDIAVPDGSVILGQESARPQEKVVVNHSHYAISHWSSGSTIDFPSIALQDRLATIIYRLPIADKERFSITHTCPRFITLSSEAIADQLVGSDIIDHELFSLLIRRIRQIDQEILYPHDSSPCRHYLEPDFASSVLSSDKGPVDEICT
ncbi:uncharacterized protein [Aegilops tauschii subsp. strangulata]|nr:uncharacterized protein LOC109771339 isoform X2 [Aegilops tauschii subsp. strangulata]